MTKKRQHIFISYARKDGLSYSKRLYVDLKNKGFDVWRDQHINPTKDFTSEIEQALDNAWIAVVILTADVRREDSFVRNEIGYALAHGIRILPLLFFGGHRPATIINHTYIDFTNWEKGFKNLVDELKIIRLGKRRSRLLLNQTNSQSKLPTTLSILDLLQVDKIEDLPILNNWKKSKQLKEADWLRAEIGVKNDNEQHEIYFKSEYDGIHALIAGAVGSGKSELLLTLITSLAINYDPTILNFVLIDYKNSSVFQPFETLPHCVDIVTNLDGQIADRMFVSIDTEIKRRRGLLAHYNVKHIVDYRQKGYHLTEEPFPHLFIVVDEFAEMITDNPKYQTLFETIGYYGRTIGINLILATHRPYGAISSQMHANMKLRICLRVEKDNDSHELLGRSDAMFLPSNIPGRAYFQAGKNTSDLLQVARVGGAYEPPSDRIPTDDVIFGNNQIRREEYNYESDTIVDLIVQRLAIKAKTHSKPQSKPWSDPLPTILPLNLPVDATYLDTSRRKKNNLIVLNQMLRVWMIEEGKRDYKIAQNKIDAWREGQLIKWDANRSSLRNNSIVPLKVPIGLIDFPNLAKQQIFTLDITDGNIALFGAPGWGKTTFLKTLIISLASIHTPDDLWIYIMDFGRSGLQEMGILPHVDSPIDIIEPDRVERLLRVLSNMIDTRIRWVREYRSFKQYNAQNPDNILPAILVVIDNFAEFKQVYEDYIPQLITIIRDGRSVGIHFVVTADQLSAIPSKLYNQFTTRLTLKLSNSRDYQAIVRQADYILTETPGRGAISIDRNTQEFQVGIIAKKDDIAKSKTSVYYNNNYLTLSQKIANEWTESPTILPIHVLSTRITLRDLPHNEPPHAKLSAPIGLRDLDRQTAWLTLNSHCLILGTHSSGKTTLLQTIIMTLAQRYTPNELAFILIDPRRQLFDNTRNKSNTQRECGNLPHVLNTISEPQEFELLMDFLDAEFDLETREKIKRYATNNNININDLISEQKLEKHQIVIVFDNYDDIEDLENFKLIEKVATMARKYSDKIHVIVSGTTEIIQGKGQSLVKRIRSARNALVLGDVEIVKNLGSKVRFDRDLPVGRGFSLQSGRADLFQVARLANDEDYFQEMDIQVLKLIQQYKESPAEWHFQGSANLLQRLINGESIAISTPKHEPQIFEIDPDIAELMRQIEEDAKKYTKDD